MKRKGRKREKRGDREMCVRGRREKLHHPHSHMDLSREGWPRGLQGNISFTLHLLDSEKRNM